jgi:hypothetical protein
MRWKVEIMDKIIKTDICPICRKVGDDRLPACYSYANQKAPISTISMSTTMITEIITTMRHAQAFISSKQKMHADGIELYDKLLKGLEGENYGES